MPKEEKTPQGDPKKGGEKEKTSQEKLEGEIKKLIEIDFPIKVKEFLAYDASEDNTAVVGEFTTPGGEVYIFHMDFKTGKPILQRHF